MFGIPVVVGIKMKIDKIHDRIVLFSAFRYALGRKTYVVSSIVEAIIECWDQLPPSEQVTYHKEIQEAIHLDKAGMDMDVQEWKKVLNLKVKNIYQ